MPKRLVQNKFFIFSSISALKLFGLDMNLGWNKLENMSYNSDMARNEGFTLIEVAVVVLVAGVLALIGITAFGTYNKQARLSITEQRIEVIMDALSAFAVRNYRLPCPADPALDQSAPAFGTERDSGADGTNIATTDCTGAGEADGLLPFRALGLENEEVKDGWGNFITYKVSVAFTADPETTTIPVHALCRTSEWIEAGRNKALQKARYCCTGNNLLADITINTCAPTDPACAAPYRIWPFNRDAAAGWYDNTATGNVLVDPDITVQPITFGVGPVDYYDATSPNVETIAYALISHGENENGAFAVNGTNARIGDTNGDGITVQGGTCERLNGTTGQINVWSLPRDMRTGATHFDDIVRWQTQGMTLARLGRDSCAVP